MRTRAVGFRPDDALPALGLALDFMRVLWALDHGLQARSKRMKAVLGVTGPQRLVIRIIGKFPGLSPGQLARALHIHPSTLTGVLARLETRGAIQRTTAPEDARRSRLYLTGSGERINRCQLGTVEASIRRTLVRLNEREVSIARRVLGALTRDLEEYGTSRSAVKR